VLWASVDARARQKGVDSQYQNPKRAGWGLATIKSPRRATALHRSLEPISTKAPRKVSQTRPTVAQPAGDSQSGGLVEDIPEPGRSSSMSMPTFGWRNHQNVGALARSQTVGDPEIGDVSHQFAQHCDLCLVVVIRVLFRCTAAASSAHGDGGSGSI
jgi:hypothetical protein